MTELNQDPDDFLDDWGDLSQSFQDELLQNIASIESAAKQANVQSRLDTKNKKGVMNTSSTGKENTFLVYTDTPSLRPAVAKSNTRQTLQEISNHRLVNPSKDHVSKTNEKRATHDKTFATTDKPSPRKTCEIAASKSIDEDDDMWIEFDVDLLSMVQDVERKESEARAAKRSRKNDTVPIDEIDAEQVEFNLNKFGGFTTAGSKKPMNAGSEARKKALAMFADDGDAMPPETAQKPDSYRKNGSTRAELNTASKNYLKLTNEVTNNKIMREPKADINKNGGASTGFHASGNHLVKLANSNANENVLGELDCNSLLRGEKRSATETPTLIDSKHDNILSTYGGFSMGGSKALIAVSDEAKKQAIALLSSDTTASDQTPVELSHDNNTPNEKRMHLLKDQYGDKGSHDKDHLSIASSTYQSRHILPLPSKKRINSRKARPFKSPIVQSKYELTKAALSKTQPAPVRHRRPCLFNINPVGPRQKLCSLGKPLSYTRDDLVKMGISEDIIEMTAKNSKHHTFDGWGTHEAEKDMIEAGALPNLIPDTWVQNHYGWIVWKIACMIRSFPHQLQSRWNRTEILDQLLYRYEREINLGHRSVLKRIVEQDDIPSKHMVLAIADIIKLNTSNTISQADVSRSTNKYQLLLTDGWYQILACTDVRMERAIASGKLKTGHKLSITGAQLIGDRTARSPLSTSNSMSISISANGCLPAEWDTKLGYHRRKLVIRSLSSFFEDGGAVTALDVIICRKYPILYTETFANRTTITRTIREEEELRQRSTYSRFQDNSNWIPNFTAADLDDSLRMPQDTGQVGVEDQRVVSCHFKIRICDSSATPSHQPPPIYTLLILNANELTHNDIVEGSRYRIFFLQPYVPKVKRFPGLYFKTTRSTRWELIQAHDASVKPAYEPRHIVRCGDINGMDRADDIDMTVYILHTSSPVEEKRPMGRSLWCHTLLATDDSKSLCQITLRLGGRPLGDMRDQYGVAHMRATDETEVIIKRSSMLHQQQAMDRVRQWSQSCPEDVTMMHHRVAGLMHL
ncbi:Breast cancer 2, early onset [Apophysomyces sp. BC1034]|nr:Breast cancer 2, early onset [Apophysomyces sp. BC1034]